MASHILGRTNCAPLLFRITLCFALLLLMGIPGNAQSAASINAQNSSSTTDSPTAAIATSAVTQRDCIEPEPVFTGLEYTGPFNKAIVHIIGKPEIKTVHLHHGRGRVCTLPARKKFDLFVKDTFEPVTFVIAGFNAGIAQAEDDDPPFGQGMEGYGKRFGAAFADQVSGEFWGTFFFPTVLREDPRYYREGHGSTGIRLVHAVGHAFVTRRDSGARSFNFSEWMSTSTTTALGNLYHPGNRRGFQPAARGVAYSVAFDAGFDILREFWPEITQNLHMPFIAHTHPDKK